MSNLENERLNTELNILMKGNEIPFKMFLSTGRINALIVLR